MNVREGTYEECCGACRYMPDEDTDGFGWCERHNQVCYCGNVCEDFEKEPNCETCARKDTRYCGMCRHNDDAYKQAIYDYYKEKE